VAANGDHWRARPLLEFVVEENGVLLHKVDVFSTSSCGTGYAVLTQAPAAEWSSDAALLRAVRNTLIVY